MRERGKRKRYIKERKREGGREKERKRERKKEREKVCVCERGGVRERENRES